MTFPPETALRLSRKALVEALGKMKEARDIAGNARDVTTTDAIERASISIADVIANVDYQLTLLTRRQRA
jgi:hypothetical protein